MGGKDYYDWLPEIYTTEDDSDSPPEEPSRWPTFGRGRGLCARQSLERQMQPPPPEVPTRSCHASPAPRIPSPPSPGASSDSSDDCAELRRLCQSQEDIADVTSPVNGFQLPLYNRFVLPPSIPEHQEDIKIAASPETDFQLPFYSPFVPPPPIPTHLPWSLTLHSCGAKNALTPVKRATDDQFSSVKRSRSTSDIGVPRFSPQPASRGGLQWKGPSTYSMHCAQQQDQEADKDSSSPTMFCYQEEDTAEVVFRPRFYSPQPSPPPTRPVRRQRLSFWTPPARAVPEAAAPKKAWPYSFTSKVGLVDSHCHLDFIFNKVGHYGTYAKFRLEHTETFPECYEGCVAIFCNPVTFKQYNMWDKLLSEDGVWGAFGCHPHYVREYNDQVEEHMVHALDHSSVVALGEIGLDYSYKNQCDRKLQQDVFRRQLQLAMNRRLPLVIHSRDSTEDTIRILKEMVPADYPIHRHCFTGDWPEAQEWLNAFPNLCLGLTPLVAYANVPSLIVAARNIPLDRLLLETDAPYFLPKQETGKLRTSHPGMVIHVATRLAVLRDVPLDTILATARENTRRIYKI